MHPFLKDGKFIAFAHRGGALEATENTCEAFAYAIGLGYRCIETDVQLTSDGVVVVFHDDELDRVTDGTGPIRDRTWAEVKALRVLGAGRIPRLEEVLEAWPEIGFNIDAKTDEVAAPLCRIAAQHDLDRICLASSSDKRIKFIRSEIGPGVCTVGGPWETARFMLLALVGLPSGAAAADCFQVPLRAKGLAVVTERTVRRTRDAGKPMHVWTIDEETEMARLIELGINGIMTDRPGALKSVLERLDLWE